MSIKSLGSQSLIYGAGHVAARGVTFLLLPIYTNIFSLEDYGIISLIYTFLGFMNVVLHYGLDASLLKHYMPADSEERKTILSNAYGSFLITTILFSVLLIIFRNNVSGLLFGINLPNITLLVVGILFFDVLWSIHVLILRAEERPVYFSIISFLNVLSTLALNILFVIYLELGIYGVLLSNLITSGVIFLITFPIILKRSSIKSLSLKYWKKMMKFGVPFLPAGIFSMILELSDRYILRYLTDIETVGLYNAGYKLGLLILLIVMGFNMAWQPYFLKKEKEERKYIADVTTLVFAVLGFFWILLLLWSDTMVKMKFGDFSFFGEQYWEATSIVPIIGLAYVFHAGYLIQLPGVYLLEKTGWIPWVRGLGALSNIILNFLFIPEYGIVGAASATCLSFMLMAVIFYFINRSVFPILYQWRKLGIIILTIGVIIIFHFNFVLVSSEKIVVCVFYPIILTLTKVVRWEQFEFSIKSR
jgi:O-antigen/teichoic acid export membrane protein